MKTAKLNFPPISRIKEFIKENKLLNPTVVVLEGDIANEYSSLMLFSENMRLASQALDLAMQLPPGLAIHVYASAIVTYRQMFKKSTGLSRDINEMNLLEDKLRDIDGNIKMQNGKELQVLPDRFYIEEFCKCADEGFQIHLEMIEQADKYICHFDKESEKNAFALLVVDGEKPFHLLNHFEYLVCNVNDLRTMQTHCNNLQSLTNNKLEDVGKKLWSHIQLSSLSDYKNNQFFSAEDFSKHP